MFFHCTFWSILTWSTWIPRTRRPLNTNCSATPKRCSNSSYKHRWEGFIFLTGRPFGCNTVFLLSALQSSSMLFEHILLCKMWSIVVSTMQVSDVNINISPIEFAWILKGQQASALIEGIEVMQPAGRKFWNSAQAVYSLWWIENWEILLILSI